MAKELDKQYSPQNVEDRTYKFWCDHKYFHAEVNPDKKPYTIGDSTAEHYRPAAHGSRVGRDFAGYSHPLAPYGGLRDPVAAWHGPRVPLQRRPRS